MKMIKFNDPVLKLIFNNQLVVKIRLAYKLGELICIKTGKANELFMSIMDKLYIDQRTSFN